MNYNVGFDLTADSSGFTVGINQAVKAQQDLSNDVKAFEVQTKSAFKESTDEVDNFSKEILNSSKTVGKMVNETGKIAKTKSYVQQLKAEIKQYTSEAAKAGEGTKVWAENLAKAGKLKDELADLNANVNSLNGNIGENFSRAAGESISLVSQGFEGLTAIQVLSGKETENFEKTLLKLQSLNALANIAKEFGGLKDKITEIKLGFQPLTNLYTKGNDALKAFATDGKKNTDGLAASNKGLFTSLSGGIKSFVSSGISGFKSLWATIAANPLGVILVVVGGLITTLVALKDKIKPIGALFDFLGKAVDKLLQPIQELAQLLGLIADENERRAKETIESTRKEIDAIKELYDYEFQLAELSGKHRADIERKKYEETRKRLNETIAALDVLKKANNKLNEEEIKSYEETQAELLALDRQRTLDVAKEQNERKKYFADFRKVITSANIAGILDDQQKEKALSKQNTLERLKAADDALHQLANQDSKAYEALAHAEEAIRKEGNDELAAIDKKYADKKKENDAKILQMQKDFGDAYLEILKKVEAGRAKLLNGEDAIEAETDAARRELDILRKNLIAKGQAEEDFEAKVQNRKAKTFKLTADQEEQFQILESMLFDEQTQKLIALQNERDKALAQLRADSAASAEAALQSNMNAEVSGVNSIATPANIIGNDFKEQDFEEQKQIAILNIQKKYAEKRLALRKAALAAEYDATIQGFNIELKAVESKEDKESQIKRDEILKRITLTQQQYQATQVEVDAGLKAELTSIDNQLAQLNKRKPFNMARLLGIREQDLQNIQTALGQVQEAFDTVLDDVIAKKDEEIAAAEETRKSYEQDVKDLTQKLTAEDQLQELGKANNRARLLQEIEDKKQQQAKALELEKKALEDKKKAQREQLLVDSITQASNLAVAASEILEATAGGGPVGVAIGVVTIAAMIAAFAASKVSALKAINSQSVDKNLKDGEVNIKGPGTETSDSIPANLSKGESVFSAKHTRENLKLFHGIHSDDKRLMHEGVLDLIKGKGISLLPDIKDSLVQKRNEIRTASTHNYIMSDNKRMEKELADINTRFEALLKEQRYKTYTDVNGNLVKQMGSHQIVIRK